MPQIRRTAGAWKALVLGLTGLVGCQQLGRPPRSQVPLLGGGGPTARITAAQEADAQIDLGRAAEARGELDQARTAYLAALGRDKHRADAYQRLAILADKQGKFRESADLYRRALEAGPGSPDIYCDMGYSLYLQRRWTESEMNLRQAVALDAKHHRAHNNLGLVLAHNLRLEEAVTEFRKAGCAEAEARENVAFVQTIEKRWPEARRQYQLALQAQPASETARTRLRELDTLVAKVESRPTAPRDRNLVPTSATLPRVPAARPKVPAARPKVSAARPKVSAVRPKTPAPRSGSRAQTPLGDSPKYPVQARSRVSSSSTNDRP